MDFMKLAMERYSCKSFDGRMPLEEKLHRILEAGRLAPTAKNLQEVRTYVIRSKDGLSRVDGITPCRYNAPVVLAVTYDKNNVFTYPGGKRDSGCEDAVIVATHMLLASEAEGVNSCWINFFDPEKAKAILGLPENEEIVMLLDLGYKSGKGNPLPNHSSRKPLEDTVKYI